MSMNRWAQVSVLTLTLVLAGPALAKDAPPPPPDEAPLVATERGPNKGALDKLPAAKRALVHEAFDKAREESKSTFEAILKLHKEQQALLGAPTFDRDTFLGKSTEIHNLRTLIEQKHAEALASVAEKLTADERVILAQSMPFGQGGPHHGRANGPWKKDGAWKGQRQPDAQ